MRVLCAGISQRHDVLVGMCPSQILAAVATAEACGGGSKHLCVRGQEGGYRIRAHYDN